MRRFLLCLACVGALAAVLPGSVDAGACASRGQRLIVLSPTERPLPSDAAVVVGYGPWSLPLLATTATRATSAPSVRLRGQTAVATTTEEIAPGLYRVVPGAALAPGAVQVSAGGDSVALQIEATPAAPVVAPTLRAVSIRNVRTTSRMGTPETYRYSQLVLASAPPADVIAVIVYAVEGEALTPFQWLVLLEERRTALPLWSGPGRCEVAPAGMRAASSVWSAASESRPGNACMSLTVRIARKYSAANSSAFFVSTSSRPMASVPTDARAWRMSSRLRSNCTSTRHSHAHVSQARAKHACMQSRNAPQPPA